jgi:flagellin
VSFSDNVLSDVNVLTRQNASSALSTVDFALQQVNGLRAELGAVQSRFENTITNLSTQAENLSAARSRIQDADFAAETAALTRAQILQQAGISALAQANAAPQSVLSLLG